VTNKPTTTEEFDAFKVSC